MNKDVAIPFDHPFEDKDLGSLETLQAIMAALRDKKTGCPWDIEQDFSTIAPYTLEEAFEVADAIQRGDMGDLREELGDLLLQVVYHAQMASEDGEFCLSDVVRGICTKMIRRHPHVFGDEETRSASRAKGFWEKIKAAEKAARSKDTASSILDNVPLPMPALTRAEKLQKKAARIGFDWPDPDGPWAKLAEEREELDEAIASCNRGAVFEEFGDFLFAAANLARHYDIDPEDALRQANAKFIRRFRHIETELAAGNRSLESASLEEMEQLWREAKSRGL